MAAADDIQAFLDLFDRPAYLEIGVQDGLTLKAVRAARKVAVDPVFRFDAAAERARSPHTSFYEMTSDGFFAGYRGAPFDVVFLDGLHTSEQTLRDLLNVLAFTTADSIIVIDDVRPNSYAASLPSEAEMAALKAQLGDLDPSWMGDVYRLAYFVDSFLQQYSYATPPGPNARLVLWREARARPGERTIAEVGQVDFHDFARQPDILRPRPLPEIIAAYERARDLRNAKAPLTQRVWARLRGGASR